MKPIFKDYNVVELLKEGWKVNNNYKLVKSLLTMIRNNDGECPCQNPGKTHEDRCCPCKEYRENNHCCCKMYVKDEDDNSETNRR